MRTDRRQDSALEREGDPAVRRTIEAYGDRLRTSDIRGIVELYTDDGALIKPGQETAVGKQQIQAASYVRRSSATSAATESTGGVAAPREYLMTIGIRRQG